MRHLKMLGLAVLAAMVVTAVLGGGTASATALYKTTQTPNDPLGVGTEIAASLKSGSSLLVRDQNGISQDTCTGSELKGKTEGGGGTVTVPLSATFTGCSHTTDVIKPGKLHIAWSSATNGTLTWSGAEVTIISTVFGSSCIGSTGEGTSIGTVTAAKSATDHATIDLNAVIPTPCGKFTWTGTYTLTSPTGLVVEGS